LVFFSQNFVTISKTLRTKAVNRFFLNQTLPWLEKCLRGIQKHKLTAMDLGTIQKELKELRRCQERMLECLEFLIKDRKDTEVEEWVDHQGVEKMLKISPSTLYRYGKKKLINFCRLGGRNYYLLSEVYRCMKELMKWKS